MRQEDRADTGPGTLGSSSGGQTDAQGSFDGGLAVGRPGRPQIHPGQEKRSKRRSTGAAIGGILAGFDQQIFRTQPPAHELVHHARPDDPVPASDGGRLLLTFPPATVGPDVRTEGSAAAEDGEDPRPPPT